MHLDYDLESAADQQRVIEHLTNCENKVEDALFFTSMNIKSLTGKEVAEIVKDSLSGLRSIRPRFHVAYDQRRDYLVHEKVSSKGWYITYELGFRCPKKAIESLPFEDNTAVTDSEGNTVLFIEVYKQFWIVFCNGTQWTSKHPETGNEVSVFISLKEAAKAYFNHTLMDKVTEQAAL